MHSEPKVSVGKFRGVILPAVMLRGQGFGADRQVLSADFTPYRLTHRKLSLHGGIDRGLVEFWNAAAGDHALLVRTFFRHNSGKIRERSNGNHFQFAAARTHTRDARRGVANLQLLGNVAARTHTRDARQGAVVKIWLTPTGDILNLHEHASTKFRVYENGRGLNCCDRRLRRRFNGAVAFQRRKPGNRNSISKPQPGLQWGRRLSATEIIRNSKWLDCPDTCFNGAVAFQRRK